MTMEHSMTAYENGHNTGTLARQGYVSVSRYALHSINDFPAGSWDAEYNRGYHDAVYGVRKEAAR